MVISAKRMKSRSCNKFSMKNVQLTCTIKSRSMGAFSRFTKLFIKVPYSKDLTGVNLEPEMDTEIVVYFSFLRNTDLSP